ncbi:MAG: thiamine-phosphate kinase [Bacteroidia bacterium]
MFENSAKTTLDSLGEFGLIKKLTENYTTNNPNLIKGIGDDASIFKPNMDKWQVITTDLMVENINFDLAYTPLKHLGYKAVVLNISDIYAMNATPKFITISIALSSKYTLEALEEFYDGIYLACEKYNIDIIGGDTNTSPQGLTISITAIGEVSPDKYVTRSGCKPNDLLCVTGDLGGAYMGHQLMEREKRVFLSNPEMQPDLEGYDYIVGRQLKPEARKDVIEQLAKLDVLPTSMIDISDGLASELKHLAQQSNVGFMVYEEKLPVDTQTLQLASEFNMDATMCALNGGEDFELLFTITQADFEKIKSNMDITVIGHATNEANVCQLITPSGNQFDIKAQGWK